MPQPELDTSAAIQFAVGYLRQFPGADQDLVQRAALTHRDIIAALRRHLACDWGELDADDKAANNRALLDDARLLSSYRGANGTKFWIITEADRSATTVLLPSDY